MVKDHIVLYTKDRVPLSLGNLILHQGKFVEDIFDAVEDSTTFDELTDALSRVIRQPMVVDRVTPRYIRYALPDRLGNIHYLKIEIKGVPNNG